MPTTHHPPYPPRFLRCQTCPQSPCCGPTRVTFPDYPSFDHDHCPLHTFAPDAPTLPDHRLLYLAQRNPTVALGLKIHADPTAICLALAAHIELLLADALARGQQALIPSA
jgi:hypothetical protein